MPPLITIPGAYERAVDLITRKAASMNVPKEAFFGFVNRMGRLPNSLADLVQFLDTPDRVYGVARRDPATGAITPIMPGPTPGLTPEQRGGFNHQISNAEDSRLEPYMNATDQGIISGQPEMEQSMGNPQVAAAWSAPAIPAATGPRTAQGAGQISGTAVPFDAPANPANPYPVGSPYHDSWEAANPAPGQAGTPTPTSTGSSGGYSTGSSGGGYGTVDPRYLDSIANAAYNQARLALDRDTEAHRDENEKHRIALEAARDAWNKAYQTATLSGYLPGGAGSAGNGQKVLDAMNTLRADPTYRAADGATKRQMEAARFVQAAGGTLTQAQALQAVEQLRATSAAAGGAPSTAEQIEGVLGQVAPGAATLPREIAQNQTAMDALRLLSSLRGPENAFAYANTLQNLPMSIRQNIAAATSRLGMTAQNPAMAGLMNDVGWGGQTGQALPMGPAHPGQAIGGTGYGPRTAQGTQMYGPSTGGTPATNPALNYARQATAGTPADRAALAAAQGAYGTAAYQPAYLQQQPTYGPRTAPSGEAFNPGQISPTDYNRTDPYARKLLWAGFENSGGDIESGQWRYAQNLPRAVGPRTGQYRAA